MQKQEIKDNVSEIYKILNEESLEPNHHIVIGGASLVLQDVIEETSDVDILIASRREVREFADILIRKEVPLDVSDLFLHLRSLPLVSIEFENKSLKYQAGIEFVFAHLVKPYLTHETIGVNGIDVYVRPKSLIKLDYENYIRVD